MDLAKYILSKILRINSHVPFPVSPNIHINNPSNIDFDIEDINNFQVNGSYFQTIKGKIKIGKGTYIAPNVGIITSNHDLKELNLPSDVRDVTIGESCWIGMNSVVLPGVHLGDHTVVGAGSIVTKSYPDGYCVIAGNPARMIRRIDKNGM